MEQHFIRALVYVCVFLGAFVGLLGFIPNGFIYSGRAYNDPNAPAGDWSALYLQAENVTKTLWVWDNITQYPFSMGGRNLELYVNVNVPFFPPQPYLQLVHKYGLGLLWEEAMDWHDAENHNDGSTLTYLDLDEDYADGQSLRYTVYCLGLGGGPLIGGSSAFHVTAQVSFNTTRYDTPGEAWKDDNLYIFLGIDYDQYNTSINAWEIIGKLLTFQQVEVFGTGPEAQQLNRMVSYGLIFSIIAMAVIIIVELIPF